MTASCTHPAVFQTNTKDEHPPGNQTSKNVTMYALKHEHACTDLRTCIYITSPTRRRKAVMHEHQCQVAVGKVRWCWCVFLHKLFFSELPNLLFEPPDEIVNLIYWWMVPKKLYLNHPRLAFAFLLFSPCDIWLWCKSSSGQQSVIFFKSLVKTYF